MEENKIALPSGGWYTEVDVTTLTAKERKIVLRAGSGIPDDLKTLAYAEAMIALLITSWSFVQPIPIITIESLDLLSPADYAFLTNKATPVETHLFPDTSSSLANQADPKASIANSLDSANI